MTNTTLKDLKLSKTQLEGFISEVLTDFVNEHGVSISDIELDTHTSYSIASESITRVEVEVKVEL